MKPRLGFGRLPVVSRDDSRRPNRDAAGDRDSANDRAEEISIAEDLPRPVNTGPVRPDLGPPAPGPQSANQPGSGLGLVISVAIAALVLVLAFFAIGSPTTNPLPLAQTTNALFWILALFTVAAAGIGAEYADRTASRARERDEEVSPGTAWIVPTVATAAAIGLVATFHNTPMIAIGPLIAFLGNAGALLSRDLLDDADDSAQRTARTVHTVVVHVVACLALMAIYYNKLPTPLTAVSSGLIAVLLTAELFDRAPVEPRRKLLLSLLAGSAVAAAAVPLAWWLTYGWTGGAVLFVVFYLAAGVLRTGIAQGEFRVREIIEYGVVPLAALIVLAVTA